MPAERKNIHKNHDSLAFTLWLNRRRKMPNTQEDEVAKKVITKESNSSEKKIMAQGKAGSASRKACICSPTSHAGSFRCHLHRTTEDSSCREKKMTITNKKTSNSKTVGTIIDGQPRLSRFGRAAHESRPLTMASSKPEKVK